MDDAEDMRNNCCLRLESTAHSKIKTEREYLGRDADGLGDVSVEEL